ncbi:MAG: biotin--[acetyl-CoA-carboxylase] ligase [Gemmatimonadales bacterium]
MPSPLVADASADRFSAIASASYDGVAVRDLARRLAVPRVAAFESISSTFDEAHRLAEQGAEAGTLVVADAQTAGRGRYGRTWASEPGAGVWLTLIERPSEPSSLGVLPLRVGLALAPEAERFTDGLVSLKWPNDVYAGGGKLAGVLVEARWKAESLEWIAIGVGVNVRAPAASIAGGGAVASLRPGISRAALLEAIVPALRRAVATTGPLSAAERAAFARRDLALGRACIEPTAGRVRGVAADGALVVQRDDGSMVLERGGSLVLLPEEAS